MTGADLRVCLTRLLRDSNVSLKESARCLNL